MVRDLEKFSTTDFYLIGSIDLKTNICLYDTNINDSHGGLIFVNQTNITPSNMPKTYLTPSKNERHENYNETLVLTNEYDETLKTITPIFRKNYLYLVSFKFKIKSYLYTTILLFKYRPLDWQTFYCPHIYYCLLGCDTQISTTTTRCAYSKIQRP